MSKPSTARWIVNDLLTNWRYFADDDPVIPSLWVKGSCRLFLVLGENAGGKSFFRRCVHQCTREFTSIKEVIHISMEGRAGGYLGAVRGMIYGDEHHDSTGSNSARTVRTAIRTCEERNHSHLLYWDEPDVGMSEGATVGAAIEIAKFVTEIPDHTKGVFITTHSRAMVAALSQDLRPHYIHLGVPPDEAPQSIEEWLTREIKPVSTDEITEASVKRFRAIQKIINERKIEREQGET
jgi:hypothetical protein